MNYEKINNIPKIKNRLLEPEKQFLFELQNYLGLPIYIYGSLFRMDYFPNKSDIDLAIFSDNLEQSVNQLVQFLNVSKQKIKFFKMVSKNKYTDKVKTIYGFKTNYKIDISEYTKSQKQWHKIFYYPGKTKRFEIMLYNKKYRNYINSINYGHFSLSFLPSVCIYIIKCLYYYFFLNEKVYKYLKFNILEVPKTYNQNITVIGTL